MRIIGVVASRSGTFAEHRARRVGIPVEVVNRTRQESLAEYDSKMFASLASFAAGPPDLIVLAGFLSRLGPRLVKEYQGRLINVHPALIPSFCGPGMYGLRPHEAALERGVKVTGATVHFVDEHYDEGPIILQKCIPILSDDTPESLQLRVMQDCEQVILPEAIRLIATDKIYIDGRNVRFREGK